MKLSARHVRAAYALFRELPPYSRWKLPAPEKLSFGVNNARKEFGHYEWDGKKHRRIEISRRNVKTFHALAVVMAHEMIHVWQEQAGTYNDRAQHNRGFHRAAKHVCKVLGFDSAGFV